MVRSAFIYQTPARSKCISQYNDNSTNKKSLLKEGGLRTAVHSECCGIAVVCARQLPGIPECNNDDDGGSDDDDGSDDDGDDKNIPNDDNDAIAKPIRTIQKPKPSTLG